MVYPTHLYTFFFPFQFLGSDQPKEQDNSSEENSLSISLPSEGSQNHSNTTTRPAQHLTELRTGILKIFNDAEKGRNNNGQFSIPNFQSYAKFMSN